MNALLKWAPLAARLVLGLLFLTAGLNYFIPFMPAPPPPPARGLAFAGALMASGYVFPLIKTIEVAAAIALFSNRFVPLALTLLAPIIINIAAFHFVLAPSYAVPVLLLVLELYLAWTYRHAFAPMLASHVTPAPQRTTAQARLVTHAAHPVG